MSTLRFSRSVLTLAVASLLAGSAAGQDPGTVKGLRKLSQASGGLPRMDVNDQLGRSLAVLGDLDGNGVVDLASAGLGDDDGGTDQGAAYVLFLRPDGNVIAHQKISELEGGFTGDLDPVDQFGRALTSLGDLHGDGTTVLAVGANNDDDGGYNKGAVWLLTLDTSGRVQRTAKISSTQGGFRGPLANRAEFGRAIACLGDLDGDGVQDIAVGSPTDNTGGTRRGAVWVLFLNRDGSVRRQVKIASQTGGFTGRLRSLDWFGFSLASLGDFDGDGVPDVAVGAALDDDGAVNAGAVWLLYLNRDGTVKDHRKISMRSGDFTAVLQSPFQFGTSVARLDDLNGDGVPELAVGAVKDGDVGRERGAVYILFLTRDGTVGSYQKISAVHGGFPRFALGDWDWLGSSLAPLGDFDGDGTADIGIGARNDDDRGVANSGAIYLTLLNGAAQTLTAAGPGGLFASGERLLALDDEGHRDVAMTLDVEYLGVGPEPEGSLQLVRGDGSPGSDLVFRLTAPGPRGKEELLARLLVGRAREESVERIERTGALLDRESIVAFHEVIAAPGHETVEVVVTVPAQGAEGVYWFQALWVDAAGRTYTDAARVEF